MDHARYIGEAGVASVAMIGLGLDHDARMIAFLVGRRGGRLDLFDTKERLDAVGHSLYAARYTSWMSHPGPITWALKDSTIRPLWQYVALGTDVDAHLINLIAKRTAPDAYVAAETERGARALREHPGWVEVMGSSCVFRRA